MAHLPYKERAYHTIEIAESWRKRRTLSIPYELTVEEVERLLELNERIDRLYEEEVADDPTKMLEKVREYWGYVFNQVTILLQHCQPEITDEYCRNKLSEQDALRIIQFFDLHRDYAPAQDDGVKKKSVEQQLTDLRRSMMFCVKNGLSLLEIRKLYIDEFFKFYFELVYTLEQSGEMEKGAYDKVQGIDRSSENFSKLFAHLK